MHDRKSGRFRFYSRTKPRLRGEGWGVWQLTDRVLYRFGLPHPPALAHRLDRDTSGCLVLGRHPKALRRLGALFASGTVEKVYWAVVEDRPPEFAGRIETGLRKLNR